jgi:hypothetical protein
VQNSAYEEEEGGAKLVVVAQRRAFQKFRLAQAAAGVPKVLREEEECQAWCGFAQRRAFQNSQKLGQQAYQ